MGDISVKNIETIAYVVHDAGQPFKLEEVTLDELQPDELLVDIQYSGICATDTACQSGKINLCSYPAIFGHEGAGKILAIGDKVKNKDWKVGDRVLLSINYCEKCKFCKSNHPADCTQGTRLHLSGSRKDGTTAGKVKGTDTDVRSHFFGQSSFAKRSFVHETSVVKVPDGVKDEDIPALAAMGCGYQTGAGTVENVLKPEQDSSIIIFGLGAVGLSALMAAKYLNVRQIIGVDIFDYKLPLARELGATDVINSTKTDDLVKHVKDITDGGVDYAVDCSGAPAVIESMLNLLGMRGTAATVGVPPAGAKISIDPLMHLLGSRSYKGVREGDSYPPVYIPHLCKKQEKGEFPVEKLCKVYNYKDIEVALQELKEGKVTKPVIKW